MDIKPTSIDILGIAYSVTYCDKPSDVDHFERASLWGQIDFWKRSIRVYDNKTNIADIWDTIIHEVLHGLICELRLCGKVDHKDQGSAENENIVGLLALGLRDVMFRNGWLPEIKEGSPSCK